MILENKLNITNQIELAKGNFRFVSLMYLEHSLKYIDSMPQRTFDEIIEKYVEMNTASGIVNIV